MTQTPLSLRAGQSPAFPHWPWLQKCLGWGTPVGGPCGIPSTSLPGALQRAQAAGRAAERAFSLPNVAARPDTPAWHQEPRFEPGRCQWLGAMAQLHRAGPERGCPSEAAARGPPAWGRWRSPCPCRALAACPVRLPPRQLTVSHESPIRHGPCSSLGFPPHRPSRLGPGWEWGVAGLSEGRDAEVGLGVPSVPPWSPVPRGRGGVKSGWEFDGLNPVGDQACSVPAAGREEWAGSRPV